MSLYKAFEKDQENWKKEKGTPSKGAWEKNHNTMKQGEKWKTWRKVCILWKKNKIKPHGLPMVDNQDRKGENWNNTCREEDENWIA